MVDLYSIKDPSFIKKLSLKELEELASQIREFLIEKISKTGGHLSSNLGVVEITIAMYYVFDIETTEFLFDVGHQSYVHKILTGRAKDFDTLRQMGGISGFVSRSESKYDFFESGHSSTSISVASGLLVSDSSKRSVVLIGDSSISNGVAFEGLNYIGSTNGENSPIIILNDNKMGISKSVGALSRTFARLRSTKLVRKSKSFMTKTMPSGLVSFGHRIKRGIKGMVLRDNIFEDLGFDYFGPYNGNDLKEVIKLLTRIKTSKEPVIVHLLTKKGKGYKPSEEDITGSWHGVGPFDIKTGLPLKKDEGKESFSSAVATYLMKKRETKEFFVISPAMKKGECLEGFDKSHMESVIDVGIAEEHAADMSAGIALHKKDVVLLMYSTFSQRAFDEILNDIARPDLKVIIGIDRAGIVPQDGVTHQGIYDISMFLEMPNIIVTNPRNLKEAIGLYNFAFNQNHPFVIRYPKIDLPKEEIDYNYISSLNWEILKDGSKIVLLSYGPDLLRINEIINENNIDAMLVDAKCLKPLDYNMINIIFNKNCSILVIEQTVSLGSLYQLMLEYKEENNYKSKVYKQNIDVNTLITHGSLKDLYQKYGFSEDKILDKIKEVIENDKKGN